MELKTKINIGDKVIGISHYSKEVFIPCSTCDGIGVIIVKDKKFECPYCYGKGGRTEYKTKEWNTANEEGIVSGYNNIVKIDIDVTREKTEIRYLLGRKYSKSYSGTLWNEDDLFKTTEEAELEYKRRNKELENLE